MTTVQRIRVSGLRPGDVLADPIFDWVTKVIAIERYVEPELAWVNVMLDTPIKGGYMIFGAYESVVVVR